MRRYLLILLLPLLAACASSHVLVGSPRPPVDPATVRVYFTPPAGGYEQIAMLQSNSGSFTYGEQNKMNSVITKLRNEAAKLGANGVLFQGTEDGYGGGGMTVGAGGGRYGGRSFSSGGVGIDITPRQKYAHGIAIWMANPPPPDAVPAASVPPAPPAPPRGN
ncbi:MAG: hypothetical protein HOQ32_00865 [Lysobacter sp.]|nr:hypothetical protein [Lysobacter sp.]